MSNKQIAKNLKVKDILSDIKNGRLLLPNFQRQEAWKEKAIKKFFKAIFLGNPLGILLMVSHDPAKGKKKSQLTPRLFDGISVKVKNNAKELLLDGQQRLTALYKAFNDKFADKLYCIKFVLKDKKTGEFEDGIEVVSIPKKKYGKIDTSYKNLKEQPHLRFNSKPKGQSQKLLSMAFLNPCQSDTEWKKRLHDMLANVAASKKEKSFIKSTLNKTRIKFSKAIMPRFLLPVEMTPKQVVDIFIDINTGSTPLTYYDIVVADIQNKTGRYIEKTAKKLKRAVKNIEKIDKDKAGELIIKIACLLDDKPPSGANYTKISCYKKIIFDNAENIINGIKWTVEFLNKCRVWSSDQIPTVVPLRVLPALHQHYEKYVSGNSARKRKADKVILLYIWHAFLTTRYTERVDDLLKEDYDALVDYFNNNLNPKFRTEVEIFDKKYRISVEDISKEGSPKKEDTLARGIFLACLQDGAFDPISETELDENSYSERQYHHIFPKSIFDGKKHDKDYANRALNFLYISGSTNSEYKNDLPGTYFERSFEDGDASTAFDKKSVKENLKTHCIDANLSEKLLSIKNGAYDENDKINSEAKNSLTKCYKDFIKERSKLVGKQINKLLKHGKIS